MLSLSNASGAPSREASNIFPVVLTGADTDDASARLRALWKECNRSRRPGGNMAISASSVPFTSKDIGDSDTVPSPFKDAVLTAGGSGIADGVSLTAS